MGNSLDDSAEKMVQKPALLRRNIKVCNKKIRKEVRKRKDDSFDASPMLGIESEFKYINEEYRPVPIGIPMTKQGVHHLNGEVLAGDGEVNSDPFKITNNVFKQIEVYMLEKFDEVEKVARDKYGARVILAGLLPTMKPEDVKLNPSHRFNLMTKRMGDLRQDQFGFYVPSRDNGNIIVMGNNVALEGYCNSFQFHYQPESNTDLAGTYNTLLALSAIGWAPFVSSPILNGRPSQWKCSRVPLFEQVIEARPPHKRNTCPKITDFGTWGFELGYLTDIHEYRKFIANNQPLILPVPDLLDGACPYPNFELKRGTTWSGIRVVTMNDHTRFETRHKDSGPTIKDDVSYTAFMIGLTKYFTNEWKGKPPITAAQASVNCYQVAKEGLDAIVYWDKGFTQVSKVVNQLIPKAMKGLEMIGAKPFDYIELVEKRVESGVTPADWALKTYAEKGPMAVSRGFYEQRKNNTPVY